MDRPGTALDRRPTDAVAEAAPTRRAAVAAAADPLRERLRDGLERQLARGLARRLSGPTSGREPGRLERRLVAALERRIRAARESTRRSGGGAGRLAVAIPRRTTDGRLPARRQTTLKALAISVIARGLVRALALFGRILARSLVSTPVRRLLRLLARRAVKAAPARKAGLLALLLAILALLRRRLTAKLNGTSDSGLGAVLPALRLLVWLLAKLRGPAVRLLWVVAATLVRASRVAAAAVRRLA